MREKKKILPGMTIGILGLVFLLVSGVICISTDGRHENAVCFEGGIGLGAGMIVVGLIMYFNYQRQKGG